MAISGMLRRRRVFNLIIFLGAAGVIFLCFQVFTIRVLTGEGYNGESGSSKGHSKLKAKLNDLKYRKELKESLVISNEGDCKSEKCKLKLQNIRDGVVETEHHYDRSKNYEGNVSSEHKNENQVDNVMSRKSFNKIVLQKDIVKDIYIENEPAANNNVKSGRKFEIDLKKLPRGAFVHDVQYNTLNPEEHHHEMFTCRLSGVFAASKVILGCLVGSGGAITRLPGAVSALHIA